MLIQFNFGNYKSFRDEVSLDLSATNTTEHIERVVTIGNEKILRTAGLFGANASGKSSVYEAFEYMTDYVIRSLRFMDTDVKTGKGTQDIFPRPIPFFFDDTSINEDTTFEVFFTVPFDEKCVTYNYGFCLDNQGITEEWLNRKAKTAKEYRRVFYRDGKEIEFVGFKAIDIKMIRQGISEKVLISSLGAQLRVPICKLVRDWFINNECADFADLSTAIKIHHVLPYDFVEREDVQEDVVHFLSSFDSHIKGFEVEEMATEEEEDGPVKKYFIATKHRKIFSDIKGEDKSGAEEKEYAAIPFDWESAGTKKMFSLYQYLKNVLKKGSVFFVDELNARLHPLLVRNIILTFLNPEINNNNAQLIFTSHDTWQLSNQLLRRDEIWLTDKDEDGVSHLYSLVDFIDEDGDKIRKDENYEKNYLLGKYGAIPHLNSINV